MYKAYIYIQKPTYNHLQLKAESTISVLPCPETEYPRVSVRVCTLILLLFGSNQYALYKYDSVYLYGNRQTRQIVLTVSRCRL